MRRPKEEGYGKRTPSFAWSLTEGSDGVEEGVHPSIPASLVRYKQYFLLFKTNP